MLKRNIEQLTKKNKQLREEVVDLKDLNRRINFQARKKSDLESYYYEAIQEAVQTLGGCLGGKPRASCLLLGESEGIVAALRRVVEQASNRIKQLIGPVDQPLKKIKRGGSKTEGGDVSVASTNHVPEFDALMDESEESELSSLGEIFSTPLNEPTKTIDINNFEVEVECLSAPRSKVITGDSATFLALMSESSFMVATNKKGIKVVKNGVQVYSGLLPLIDGELKGLKDTIFIESLDCFLLCYNNTLWRKNLDGTRPSLFMDVLCGGRDGACLQNSKIHKKIVISNHLNNLLVIDLQRRQVDIELKNTFGGCIRDFKIFGENEDRVLCLTRNGDLILFGIDFDQKSSLVIGDFRFGLKRKRNEGPLSMAICDKSRYVLVDIVSFQSELLSSRMILFEVERNTIKMKACLDVFNQKIQYSLGLGCYGYVENHILWVGLSTERKGFVRVFDFNRKTGELKEMIDRRQGHQEWGTFKILRFGEKFYYTGCFGKLMTLRLT